jgi:flagellar biosynthesis GTPase FlhF
MPNALRTDYIFAPSEGVDFLAPQKNALQLQRAGLVNEGLQQQNQLRQAGIDDLPFQKEQDMVEYFGKIRPMLNFDSYPAIKQNLVTKGMNPDLLPDFDSPEKFNKFMAETDKELMTWAKGEQRKATAAANAERRKQAEFEKSELRKAEAARKKIELEDTAAKAKLAREAKFEQAKIDALKKTGTDKAHAATVKRAHAFILKMATQTGANEFNQILAAMIAKKPIDTATAQRGRDLVPPEMLSIYDAYIDVLKEELGIPVADELTYTREGGFEPIK